MLLREHGAPGARTPRVSPLAEAAHHGEKTNAPIRSRAQQASSTYQAPQPSSPASPTPSDQQPQQQQPGQQTDANGNPVDANGQPVPAQYDLSADPVLQQVQAAVALANQQAANAALDAREQALLQYGDPALAAKLLGANDPFVQAAGGNQESTRALLKRGYTEGLHNYDNYLDPSLLFSGARIKGEGQLGQTYQDDLARAAAAIQGQLSGITDTYNQAMQGNTDRLLAALADAYNRAMQNALTNPPADGSSGSGAGSSGAGGGAKKPKPKPRHKKSHLAHAAGGGGRPSRAV